MKARIFIYNSNEPFDQRVSIVIDIPALIPKGSFLYLRHYDIRRLLLMITASHDIAMYYDIFGPHEVIIEKRSELRKTPMATLIEHSRLGEFIYVCDIGYEWIEDEYQLCISLNNDPPKDE